MYHLSNARKSEVYETIENKNHIRISSHKNVLINHRSSLIICQFYCFDVNKDVIYLNFETLRFIFFPNITTKT